MIKYMVFMSLAFFIFMSCQSTQSAHSNSTEAYTEDLSEYRPTYTMPGDTLALATDEVAEEDPGLENIAVTNDITGQLNEVLQQSDEYRRQIKFVDGFTVQVYSGTQSEEARKIRGKVLNMLPDVEAKLIYDEPSFKVKVGRYFSRMEAQTGFSKLKDEFPSAIIIPERIPLDNDTD